MTDLTPYTLLDPYAAIPFLATAIAAGRELRVEVHEDKCFEPETWLDVGRMKLHPAGNDGGDDAYGAISEAIQQGVFTWSVPTLGDLSSGLAPCIGGSTSTVTGELSDKVKLALSEGLQDIARRLLLLLPTFDPAIVSGLPFRSPTTLVVDTSSVKQGALDFACRFLYPMARIKVPAVVPIEILNMTDRFLNLRRKGVSNPKRKLQCLAEHVGSQGTQRALMRLEWHSEVEVERPLTGPDPMRAIFKLDAEFKEDGMQDVHRSLADRLVFEAAREHKTQLSPEHSICVLTSDQGLARMVLSEGMTAMYFEARKSGSPLGKTLTGALFNPLTAKLYTVSLTQVLWELATCFGSARLAWDTGQFQVTAMSEELPWFPYQSREDLLWCRWTKAQSISTVTPSQVVPEYAEKAAGITEDQAVEPRGSGVAQARHAAIHQDPLPDSGVRSVQNEQGARIGGYVFSPPKLLRFVVHLARSGEMPMDGACELLGLSLSSLKQYLLFLKSGRYVSWNTDTVIAEPALAELAGAVSAVDVDEISDRLQRIPTFLAYMQLVTEHQREPTWIPADNMRYGTAAPYRTLAEISGLCVSVPDVGICVTRANPPLATFRDIALSLYHEMAVRDPWILTGAWLEQLAVREAIHPVRTRQLLDAAVEARLLSRYTEGSTIETRFEDHKLAVLTNDESGEPVIVDCRLYHGDFLSVGRASVRILLEREAS